MSRTIDFGRDRMLKLANARLDDHKYIEALQTLNQNRDINGEDSESYMLRAEIFEDMQMYDNSLVFWFRYLDSMEGKRVSREEMCEAYESIAICYMNTGNDHFSVYYYNKMLAIADEIPAEIKQEVMRSFANQEENPLRFVWPPELADYSQEMQKGIADMGVCDYENAIKTFEKIPQGNEKYIRARNCIIMCHLIPGNIEQAEIECNRILEEDPNNIEALASLTVVYSEQDREVECLEVVDRLIQMELNTPEEIYKVATVCCEYERHTEAYELLKRLLSITPAYDVMLNYFTGAAAYNSGNREDAKDYFRKLYQVTGSPILEATMHRIHQDPEQLVSYYFRLTEEERERNHQMIDLLLKLPAKERSGFPYEDKELKDAIYSCLEEMDAMYIMRALECAWKAGFDDVIRKVFLQPMLSDELKIEILRHIIMENAEGRFGMVICNIFKSIYIYPIQLGRAKRSHFKKAYAFLISRFGILERHYSQKIAKTTEELYQMLSRTGYLKEVSDSSSLAACIFHRTGLKDVGLKDKNVSEFFHTTDEQINDLQFQISMAEAHKSMEEIAAAADPAKEEKKE